MPRVVPVFTVDAFTDIAFAGNPAAVCVLEEALPEELMMRIAAEMNLAGVALVVPAGAGLMGE